MKWMIILLSLFLCIPFVSAQPLFAPMHLQDNSKAWCTFSLNNNNLTLFSGQSSTFVDRKTFHVYTVYLDDVKDTKCRLFVNGKPFVINPTGVSRDNMTLTLYTTYIPDLWLTFLRWLPKPF